MFRKLKNRFKSNKNNKKPGPPLLSIHEIKPSITSIVTIYKSRKPPNDVFSGELPYTNTSETFVFESRTSNREVNNIATEAQELLNRNIITELEKLNRWLCEAITNIQDGAIKARRPSSVKTQTSKTRPSEIKPTSRNLHTESNNYVEEDTTKQAKVVKSNPSLAPTKSDSYTIPKVTAYISNCVKELNHMNQIMADIMAFQEPPRVKSTEELQVFGFVPIEGCCNRLMSTPHIHGTLNNKPVVLKIRSNHPSSKQKKIQHTDSKILNKYSNLKEFQVDPPEYKVYVFDNLRKKRSVSQNSSSNIRQEQSQEDENVEDISDSKASSGGCKAGCCGPRKYPGVDISEIMNDYYDEIPFRSPHRKTPQRVESMEDDEDEAIKFTKNPALSPGVKIPDKYLIPKKQKSRIRPEALSPRGPKLVQNVEKFVLPKEGPQAIIQDTINELVERRVRNIEPPESQGFNVCMRVPSEKINKARKKGRIELDTELENFFGDEKRRIHDGLVKKLHGTIHVVEEDSIDIIPPPEETENKVPYQSVIKRPFNTESYYAYNSNKSKFDSEPKPEIPPIIPPESNEDENQPPSGYDPSTTTFFSTERLSTMLLKPKTPTEDEIRTENPEDEAAKVEEESDDETDDAEEVDSEEEEQRKIDEERLKRIDEWQKKQADLEKNKFYYNEFVRTQRKKKLLATVDKSKVPAPDYSQSVAASMVRRSADEKLAPPKNIKVWKVADGSEQNMPQVVVQPRGGRFSRFIKEKWGKARVDEFGNAIIEEVDEPQLEEDRIPNAPNSNTESQLKENQDNMEMFDQSEGLLKRSFNSKPSQKYVPEYDLEYDPELNLHRIVDEPTHPNLPETVSSYLAMKRKSWDDSDPRQLVNGSPPPSDHIFIKPESSIIAHFVQDDFDSKSTVMVPSSVNSVTTPSSPTNGMALSNGESSTFTLQQKLSNISSTLSDLMTSSENYRLQQSMSPTTLSKLSSGNLTNSDTLLALTKNFSDTLLNDLFKQPFFVDPIYYQDIIVNAAETTPETPVLEVEAKVKKAALKYILNKIGFIKQQTSQMLEASTEGAGTSSEKEEAEKMEEGTTNKAEDITNIPSILETVLFPADSIGASIPVTNPNPSTSEYFPKDSVNVQLIPEKDKPQIKFSKIVVEKNEKTSKSSKLRSKPSRSKRSSKQNSETEISTKSGITSGVSGKILDGSTKPVESNPVLNVLETQSPESAPPSKPPRKKVIIPTKYQPEAEKKTIRSAMARKIYDTAYLGLKPKKGIVAATSTSNLPVGEFYIMESQVRPIESTTSKTPEPKEEKSTKPIKEPKDQFTRELEQLKNKIRKFRAKYKSESMDSLKTNIKPEIDDGKPYVASQTSLPGQQSSINVTPTTGRVRVKFESDISKPQEITRIVNRSTSYETPMASTKVPSSFPFPQTPIRVATMHVSKKEHESTGHFCFSYPKVTKAKRSKLRIPEGRSGKEIPIKHGNKGVESRLEKLGLETLREISKAASCCRLAEINLAHDPILPYSVSLRSLPLDNSDLVAMEQQFEELRLTDLELKDVDFHDPIPIDDTKVEAYIQKAVVDFLNEKEANPDKLSKDIEFYKKIKKIFYEFIKVSKENANDVSSISDKDMPGLFIEFLQTDPVLRSKFLTYIHANRERKPTARMSGASIPRSKSRPLRTKDSSVSRKKSEHGNKAAAVLKTLPVKGPVNTFYMQTDGVLFKEMKNDSVEDYLSCSSDDASIKKIRIKLGTKKIDGPENGDIIQTCMDYLNSEVEIETFDAPKSDESCSSPVEPVKSLELADKSVENNPNLYSLVSTPSVKASPPAEEESVYYFIDKTRPGAQVNVYDKHQKPTEIKWAVAKLKLYPGGVRVFELIKSTNDPKGEAKKAMDKRRS